MVTFAQSTVRSRQHRLETRRYRSNSLKRAAVCSVPSRSPRAPPAPAAAAATPTAELSTGPRYRALATELSYCFYCRIQPNTRAFRFIGISCRIRWRMNARAISRVCVCARSISVYLGAIDRALSPTLSLERRTPVDRMCFRSLCNNITPAEYTIRITANR